MRARGPGGSFAIEVLVAALVAAAVAIPMLTLLFQERDTEQRSRFEYLAVLAARDEMYESRMAVLAGGDYASLKHAWVPLTKGPLERLKDAAPGVTIDAKYHPDQARVATQLDIDGAATGRLRAVTIGARWSDPQTSAPVPGKKERPTSFQLISSVLLPPWSH